MSEQTQIDPFRELNRYDNRHAEYPSDAVYESPHRTLANGWSKFHADRDCGAGRVAYIEQITHRPAGDKYEHRLFCWECGHEVPEDEVLFIGGDWWGNEGILKYGAGLEKLRLPTERVLALGPDPDCDELAHALELTRIEREAQAHGISFGNERYYECEDCGHETYLLFDDQCRMCYDGEWTERMQQAVDSAGTSVRVRNNSFAHRVEDQVDPLSIKDRAHEGMILWRRHDAENVAKLVEVKQCLQDAADDHWEYILTDVTHTREWRYHEDDLVNCFWDTGIYSEEPKPIMDERIRAV